MKSKVYALCVAVVMSGCTNTVWVREKHQTSDNVSFKQVGGVPFYIKKEVFDQTTTYYKTWLKATLTVERKLVETKENTVTFTPLGKQNYEKQLAKSRLPELDKIRAQIQQAGVVEDDDVKNLIVAYSSIVADVNVANLAPELTGNTVAQRWVVNEKEKYYLNAPLPWFGSGNLTQEIASDGTLSKVISAPDTKLAEGLSALIPFKEYLTGKYVDPLGDDSDDDAANKLLTMDMAVPDEAIRDFKSAFKVIHDVTLVVEETGYQYVFTEQYEEVDQINGPLPFNLATGKFTRSVVGIKKPEGKKKEAGKTVGLSGTISFPKDWGGGK